MARSGLDWTEMKAFAGVDLNSSYVLSWSRLPGSLHIHLQACLWPESAHYESPDEQDDVCYKQAELIFPKTKTVQGLKHIMNVRGTVGVYGEVDYGYIDSLARVKNGLYRLSGEFGDVTVQGTAPVLRIAKS